MGALLYKALLFKEIFYGLLLKGMAGLIVYIEAGHIPKNWYYLAVIIILSFPAGTYLIKKLKNFWPDSSGWFLMAFSMLKMLLIPIFIILFFDKDHEDVEAFVMLIVFSYLILMGLDTKWKIKWLWGRKK